MKAKKAERAASKLRSLIEKLGGRTIAFQPIYAKLPGCDVECALLLSQLVYWSPRATDADGWIWKKREELAEEIGLGVRQVDRARKQLRKCGVLEEELRGSPPELYFRLDFKKLADLLGRVEWPNREHQFASTAKINFNGSGKLKCLNRQNQFASNRQNDLPEPAKSICLNRQNSPYIQRLRSEKTTKNTAQITGERGKCARSHAAVSDPSLSKNPDGEESVPSNKLTTLPKDFQIDSSQFPKHTPQRIQQIFTEFCDYHRSKGTLRADWPATFRGWVRKGEKTGWDADASAERFEASDYSQAVKGFWNEVIQEEWPEGKHYEGSSSLALGIAAVDRALQTGIDPAVLKRAVELYAGDKKQELRKAEGKVRVMAPHRFFADGEDAAWRSYARLAANRMRGEREQQKELEQMQAEQSQTKSA